MASSNICSDCAVRDAALCGSLNDGELQALNSIGDRRLYPRGSTIIWAGDESVICANLLSGMLKLATSTPDGREQIVGLLYPADFVGQPYAEEAENTVQALTDVELCVFPRRQFEHVLEDHVRMERLLLQRTLTALQEARSRMLMLARKSASEKVADFLLEMAAKVGAGGCRPAPGGPLTFDLPLTRGQMADVLGLTIETVSRQLTRLKASGIITLPGSRAVTISDRAALEAIAAAA
ncbi:MULTISPECIES: Crp/Fnr family transcriptional regulator [unclassified Sphingomonas]|jgi:CRP/FNR family transcriptional regulator, anaerobic regulatory protein|uniref:Crp/Fnr family transcriptional regulator n=1 Tax=unclassified Sphingomonas TaxID=196159 RepID=UPI000E10BAD4|nr:Crp/Fnr family transcriptional regulator [Sphingomonas sp. FARSPH]AXJ97213.1 Crp/Fnr family transcriptional regulator [Sphingomonas sp. FARSPH]